jgi:uncharacterized protein YjbJ (UPF0337 family)
MMNWDQIAGRWKQCKGRVREGWGRFTNDDNSQVEGRREQIDGFLQESFGTIKELAKKQIHEFLESHPDFYAAHQRTAKQH